MRRSKLKVGDVIQSSSCGEYMITKRDVVNEATIRFIETGYETTSNIQNAATGNIKDPYFPQVLGIGYLGVGEYKNRTASSKIKGTRTSEYNAWINMLQRCYYDKYICREQGGLTYENVSVIPEWLNFQTFAEWYVPRRKVLDDAGLKRPNLDKEILSPDKKAVLYSPETCCVIPYEINAAFVNQNRTRENGLPKGIIALKEGYRVTATSIESKQVSKKFDSVVECIEWRNKIDQERYTFLANKYKSVLEIHVYNKLINWDKF